MDNSWSSILLVVNEHNCQLIIVVQTFTKIHTLK